MTIAPLAPGVAVRLGVVLAVAVAGGFELVGRAQQPVFRSTVEVIAVDVQVLDRTGNPIGQLDPNLFEVSISGKRRRVVSAEFVRHEGQPAAFSGGRAVMSTPQPPAPDAVVPAGPAARTVVLAVDTGSFEPGNIQPAMEAAQEFLRQLGPDDLVGLYVYPTVMWIPPTTQRATLAVRLANLVGERQPLRSYYNLSPHEIVDITAQSTNPNSFLTATRNNSMADLTGAQGLDPVLKIVARECRGEEDLDCAIKVYSEGMMLAAQIERETQMSLGGLDTLLRILAEIPGRKSVVLVTGGLLVSDRLDGRPDPGNVAEAMGQTAARANATIYTVHIDNAFSSVGQASRRGLGNTELSRDRALMGNWLDNFSRTAGGQRINVPVGGGEFAFDRVLRETSAYYLLGVEPDEVDRDGEPHALRVNVDRDGVTVRNRQWVVVPPRTRR